MGMGWPQRGALRSCAAGGMGSSLGGQLPYDNAQRSTRRREHGHRVGYTPGRIPRPRAFII